MPIALLLAFFSDTVGADPKPWFLEKIKADVAHQLGHTGQGVLVGVVDSGIDRNHPSFRGRLDSRWFNFLSGPDDAIDDTQGNSHGTEVAGILGAARGGAPMYGVAYGSRILALRAVGEEGDDPKFESPISSALQYAARNGVKVINGSYGPDAYPQPFIDDPDDPGTLIENPNYRELPYQVKTLGETLEEIQGLREAAAADILMVFSAGNSGLEQPQASRNPAGNALSPLIQPANHDREIYRFVEEADDLNPDDPASYRFINSADPRLATLDLSDLQGSVIGVVATDRQDRIAGYSNRCGLAWQWCLAAPGGASDDEGNLTAENGILAPAPVGVFHPFEGTSAAAPVVSGVAAVVRGAFPYLTAAQTAEVLLTTANTSGHLADRSIYGRGMVDLGRAIQGPREFGAEGFSNTFDVDTKGYDSTWTGDIRGEGGLTKRGLGVLKMAGTNTYRGPTHVIGGEIVVLGTNALSRTDVGPEGRVSGTGVVGSTRVAGVISPGAPTGSLTVEGSYTHESTATYEARIASREEIGHLNVRGSATLKGGRLRVLGIRPAVLDREYRLIHAAEGLRGDFAATDVNDYVFITLGSRKTDTDYLLSVMRKAGGFGLAAKTSNQWQAARGMDGLSAGHAVFDALVMETKPAVARSALDQLSGEIHASVLGTLTNQTELVRQALLPVWRPGQYGSEGLASKSLGPDKSAVWGQYLNSWGYVPSNGNTAATKSNYDGVLFGVDFPVSLSTRAGLMLGTGKSSVSAGERSSKAKIGNYTLAAYGMTEFDSLGVKYGAAYGWHNIETRREIAFHNIGSARAKYNARSFQLFSELSSTHSLNAMDLEFYAGLAYVRARAGQFDESGVAGLRGSASSQQNVFSTLGLRARAQWELTGRGVLNLEGGIGWRHAYGRTQPSSRVGFDGAKQFSVEGAPIARDTLLLNVGLRWDLSRSATVSIAYINHLNRDARDQGVRANASWRF